MKRRRCSLRLAAAAGVALLGVALPPTRAAETAEKDVKRYQGEYGRAHAAQQVRSAASGAVVR